MWFKAFVLLRIPISAACLLGYGTANVIWGLGGLGTLLALGAFAMLLAASIKLVRLRPGALRLGAWLLTLETAGAALLLVGGDFYHTGKVELLSAASTCAAVALLWVLPNVLLFYKARKLFSDPAKDKPGL